MPASRRRPWCRSSIVDEESGLRGYETTGDPRFLQPFTDAESHVQEEIQNLDKMAGADADQKHDHRGSARRAPDLAATASPCL